MSVSTVSVTRVPSPAPEVPPTRPVRICAVTGLSLIRYPLLGTWRVYKKAYGPVSGRPRVSDSPTDWNRFDLPGQATLYTSTKRQGAYAEVLADLRPKIDDLEALAARVFDDVDEGSHPIHDEWCERGHMLAGNIARIWQTERLIAQIDVPRDQGWYIDIENPVSLQVLRTQLAPVLKDQKIADMDVSVIRGHNRVVTCAAAEWISQQYLDDGSVPLGIRYLSRHGTEWECWATLPETKTTAAHTETLDVRTDTDLRTIAELFNLRLHD